jgi:hypothetical protein
MKCLKIRIHKLAISLRNEITRMRPKFWTPSAFKLRKLYSSGELIIIPIGFRCYTKQEVYNHLGLTNKFSYPFDSGFFPPESVASVLERQEIHLDYDALPPNHSICIKTEGYNDSDFGNGIKFQESSYGEVGEQVTDPGDKKIDSYLDSTYGYYTLDKLNKYVLAHYNWHSYASNLDPTRKFQPAQNLAKINDNLNRRMQRLIKDCQSAKHLIFVFSNRQNYNYMMINDEVLSLRDLDPVRKVTAKLFPSHNIRVKHLSEISSPSKLISCLFGDG